MRLNLENTSLYLRSFVGDWKSVDDLLNSPLVDNGDSTALPGWHYKKAVCAYHLGAWDKCIEHVLAVLRIPESTDSPVIVP